jgi:hypothetical protein
MESQWLWKGRRADKHADRDDSELSHSFYEYADDSGRSIEARDPEEGVSGNRSQLGRQCEKPSTMNWRAASPVGEIDRFRRGDGRGLASLRSPQ